MLYPASCTDANLYHLVDVPNLPNKVAFTGQACTDNPVERRFPLRVVYVMDASPNLPGGLDQQRTSDLITARANAVRDSVQVLRNSDTEFALVRFGGDAFVAPEGGTFTQNTATIAEAAGALTVPVNCGIDGCRRTGQALSLASSLITGDLLSTARGPRSRTTYVIVLVQAGPIDDVVLSAQTAPDDDCFEGCILANRMNALREFVLENGAADFRVHTLDVSVIDDDNTARQQTQFELEEIATRGGGEYRGICRRDVDGNLVPASCGPFNLSLLGLDIQSARNVLIKRSFIVSNLNAKHTEDGEIPDSDADGLSDAEEEFLGTDPTLRDTDGDGIGDKVESLLSTVGLDPMAPDEPIQCDAVTGPLVDQDGDGLTDCEERLLRLDPTLFDSDADGIPDLIEFLSDTNYLGDDVLVDSDFDGVPNGVEVRAHSDPRAADTQSRAELSYLYREVDLGIRQLTFSTQPREISGVVVENITPNSGLGNGLLTYIPGPTPVLAWRDPSENVTGPAVRIEGDGTYNLESFCTAASRDCASPPTLTVSVTQALLPPFPVDEFLRVDVAERACTDFRVRNVTLVETLAADGKERGANDIRIYFGQVPGETPSAFPIFRVAQFPFRFRAPEEKVPNVADQNVESFRFVLFGE